MMGGGMMWMHGWGGLLSILLYLTILFGFVLLLVWAITRMTRANTPSSGQSSREIIKLRYVRGEITREQYQQILSDLQ